MQREGGEGFNGWPPCNSVSERDVTAPTSEAQITVLGIAASARVKIDESKCLAALCRALASIERNPAEGDRLMSVEDLLGNASALSHAAHHTGEVDILAEIVVAWRQESLMLEHSAVRGHGLALTSCAIIRESDRLW